MKTQIKFSAILLIALSFCLNSCGKIEEIGIEEQSEEVGFLNLKAQLQKEIYVSATSKPPTLDVILDDLTVDIYLEDVSGFYVLQLGSNYRDLPAIIELPTGNYHINMYSSNFRANQYTSRFDDPDYGWSSDFVIASGSNTEVDAILNLLDTAVTIDFTDEVLTEFPNINVEAAVSYVATGLTEFQSWTSLEDATTAYYSMTEFFFFAGITLEVLTQLSSSLSIQVSAGSSGFVTRVYDNISPNEHYVITVSYSGDSSATINVTLGDETIIEDDIPFPG